MRFTSTVALALAAASLLQISAADLVGKITLRGDAPATPSISLDKPCADAAQTNSIRILDYSIGRSNALADVIVYIKETPSGAQPHMEPVVFDKKGCVYTPHIAAAQVNQPVLVRNSDSMMHSVRITPTEGANRRINLIQYAKAADLNFTFAAPEAFIPIKSDFQNTVSAYLYVLNTPCFVVTAKDGTYRIPDLPNGSYTLVAHHRLAGSQEKLVTITGKNSTNNFTFEAR